MAPQFSHCRCFYVVGQTEQPLLEIICLPSVLKRGFTLELICHSLLPAIELKRLNHSQTRHLRGTQHSHAYGQFHFRLLNEVKQHMTIYQNNVHSKAYNSSLIVYLYHMINTFLYTFNSSTQEAEEGKSL